MSLSKIVITFLCGFTGGLTFHLLHLPLPWALGAAAAIMVLKSVRPDQAQWPRWLSDLGLMTIAYMLGRSMTSETAKAMVMELPGMISASVLWVLICFLIGKGFAKVARLERVDAILGSMPGGLSQMVLVADNMGANPGTVALIQTSRLIVVLYTIPFLATVFAHPQTAGAIGGIMASTAKTSVQWSWIWGFLLLPLVPASTYLLKRFRVPASEFLGPALMVGTFSAMGCPWPSVPSPMLATAQLLFGIYIGARVQPRLILTNKRLAPLAFIMAFLLVSITVFAAWVLSLLTNTDIVTWFLALAPGGLGEVATTAVLLDANVVMVTAYQMFRLFFILLVAPPILKKIIARTAKDSPVPSVKLSV